MTTEMRMPISVFNINWRTDLQGLLDMSCKKERVNNIGIKHDFLFINIRKVPREALGFQHLPWDLANVNE